MGPTPGAVLRHNAEHDIQASALYYMVLDEMPSLEQRLEQMLDDKEGGPLRRASPNAGQGADPSMWGVTEG